MTSTDQSRVIEFLSRPGTICPGTAEKIETHISLIFLGPERAFKLKRAVAFPYLDFSTADKRRRACEAEVSINRRTAPDLYVGVAAVTRQADGSLAIDGVGEAVDWLVEMKRFDRDGLLDRLARRGKLDRRLMGEIAENIAAFHATAAPARNFGGRDGMAAIIAGNREVFAEFGPGVVDGDKSARLFDNTMAALDSVSGLLDSRREEGFVRRCHGDLHLRNIVVIAGRPVLFDAIEFNDAISHIDVLYDLAFLLMDLDHRGLRRLANITFNRYLDVTGDVAGLPTLPLFMSVRAAIRAHVAAAMLRTVAKKKSAADELRRQACAYLDMALAYLAPPPPGMLAVGGLSGSGKSRMARELAPYMGAAPGARVARSDVLRKRLLGVRPLERLGPQGYTVEMTEKTYRAVFEDATIALESGYSAIADAVFAKPLERTAARRLAGDLGVPFDGLWLEAPQEIMMERVGSRKDNASDADAKILRRQLTYDLGHIEWRVIDSSGSRKETLARGLRILGLSPAL